ncbi:hypothetical protein NL676_001483 [Syzygium grande]|nr:hypothetical protein NL676_001483 [Syzygium grande]
MSGIIHKIEETLHMGGGHKEGEHKKEEHKGEHKPEHKEGHSDKIKDQIHGGHGSDHHDKEAAAATATEPPRFALRRTASDRSEGMPADFILLELRRPPSLLRSRLHPLTCLPKPDHCQHFRRLLPPRAVLRHQLCSCVLSLIVSAVLSL